MRKRWNHAITLAFSVDSDQPDGPTLDEAMAALEKRVELLRSDQAEAREALLAEVPFDTYEYEDGAE